MKKLIRLFKEKMLCEETNEVKLLNVVGMDNEEIKETINLVDSAFSTLYAGI